MAAGALALALAASGVAFFVKPVFSLCEQDDDLPAADRAALSSLALDIVRAMRTEDIDSALALMSTEARSITKRDALVRASTEVRAARADGELSVPHVYRLLILGSDRGMAMCGVGDDATFLARGGGMRTAYVEVAEPVNGAKRTHVVWLRRETGEWRVHAVHMFQSEVAGYGGEEIWRMAEQQGDLGYVFNASLLSDLAFVLLNRGPNMRTATFNQVADSRRQMRRHADLPGPPPLTFTLGDRSFPIGWATTTGTGDGALVLLLDQRGPVVSVAEALAKNHEFIDAMNVHRPEWREVYDALAVGYPTGEGGRVWRTVYNRESGYLEEPARAVRD